MSSKVISFRFNDAEIQALEALQTEDDGDSLNQTAARLLRGLLGTSREVSTGVDISKLVEEKISAAVGSLQTKLELVEERLGKLNAPCDKDESLRLDVLAVHPDYTAVRSRTLKKLKVGSQSAAGKAVDAFIRELERAYPPQNPTRD